MSRWVSRWAAVPALALALALVAPGALAHQPVGTPGHTALKVEMVGAIVTVPPPVPGPPTTGPWAFVPAAVTASGTWQGGPAFVSAYGCGIGGTRTGDWLLDNFTGAYGCAPIPPTVGGPPPAAVGGAITMVRVGNVLAGTVTAANTPPALPGQDPHIGACAGVIEPVTLTAVVSCAIE